MTAGQHIVTAVKGIIVHKGKVLIVRRAEDDVTGAGTWECPGGKMEFGEDLEDALIREVKEETGLAITAGRLLFASTFLTRPDRQIVILTYLAAAEQPDVILSEEHSEYRWASKADVRKWLNEGIIRDFDKNQVFSLPEWE